MKKMLLTFMAAMLITGSAFTAHAAEGYGPGFVEKTECSDTLSLGSPNGIDLSTANGVKEYVRQLTGRTPLDIDKTLVYAGTTENDVSIFNNTVYRYSDFDTEFWFYKSLGDNKYVTYESLMTHIETSRKTKAWADETAAQLIVNGASRTDVAYALASYVHDHVSYAYEAANSTELRRHYSEAWNAITEGKGACVAVASLFRALYESVPFNPETGLSDWTTQTPVYETVTLYGSSSHCWSGITNPDGTVSYYDVGTIGTVSYLNYSYEQLLRKSATEYTISVELA